MKITAIADRHGLPLKYGGGIRCNTMQLIRAKGPMTFCLGPI
jgi:hypothetical protein